jgi:hypothetical protein
VFLAGAMQAVARQGRVCYGKSMEEDRESIYLESTIPSYATARPSTDVIAAAHQSLTRIFWEEHRFQYDLYISEYVLEECGRGDSEAARKRLDLVAGIPIYPKTAEIVALATIYQKLLDIPNRAKVDCCHLAVCVLESIDYLLTWNCGHLGPVSQVKVRDYNDKHGLWTPTLVTPESFVTPM